MSKRASEYKHGQPGREFEEERPEDPADTPKKATAAQLASRKIKTLKGRKPTGVSSGLSSFNPNPPSASAFDFGPDPNANAAPANPFAPTAPQPQQNAGGGFGFGQPQQQNAPSAGTFAFGSNSTSSFPQPSAPNPFGTSTPNSSFPPASGFGGSNMNSNNGSMPAFNAQPDLNFGNTSTAFGATPAKSSPFGSQQSQPSQPPASNAFNFLGAAANKDSNTTAPGSPFGNNNNNNNVSTFGTSQPTAFGGFGQNNGTLGSGSTSITFGNTNNNAAATASPFQFGASTTPAKTAQNSASKPQASFGNISAAAPSSSSSETPKPMFGSGSVFGATQTKTSSEAPKPMFASTNNASSQAPANQLGTTTGSPFQFGSSSPGIFAFGTKSNGVNKSTQDQTSSTPAPATSTFNFGNSTAAPATTATSNGFSGAFGATTSASTPTPALFGTLGQSSKSSMAAPVGGSLFPLSQGPAATPLNTTGKKTPADTHNQYVTNSPKRLKSSTNPSLKPSQSRVNQHSSSSLEHSTAEPSDALEKYMNNPKGFFKHRINGNNFRSNTKTTSTEAPKQPPTANETTSVEVSKQPSTATATTSQTPFKKTSFGNYDQGSTTQESAEKEKPAQNSLVPMSSFTPASAQKPATNTPAPKSTASIFAPVTSTSSPTASIFAPVTSTSSPTTSTFAPTSTSTAITASQKEVPNNTAAPPIPRVTVPPSWTANTADSNDIIGLTKELTTVNEAYRAKVAQLHATADWSALSKWHLQRSSELKKKIDDLKKRAAVAKGITGEGSILSTKRSNDESTRFESPVKKARSGDAPSTPKSQAPALPSTTPKANPNSFNLFASGTTQQSTPVNIFAGSTPQGTSTAADKPAPITATENKENEPGNVGGFKPNFGASTTSTSTGFKPNLGTSTASTSTGFKPNFGSSSAAGKSGGGGFFGQFGGKTKEEMRNERMKKALAGYESPTTSEEEEGGYETKAEFLARWNREEDERQANLDEAAKKLKFEYVPTTAKKTDTPTFKFGAASNNTPATSQSLASGTSTPGLFSSRIGSPALSTEGGRSVFDTPVNASTPNNNNIFGNLSAASSQHRDDSDDEADDESAKTSIEGESNKRKHVDTVDAESESSETLEETMRRKKPDTKQSSLLDRVTRDNSDTEQDTLKKPSLADRMTRDNSEAAPEGPLFNFGGSQTPAPKKQFQFDFAGAAAKSAPPKQNLFDHKADTFAGDQTFKFGSPIKFGTSASANSPFTITPATPTAATPTQPASNPFAFLSTATSAATSTVSSRAATPATDAEASGADSAAVNEEEDQNYVEADKSDLTDAEREEFNVLFEAEQAIATKLIKEPGTAPAWKMFGNGRLWILRSKGDAPYVVIRMRMKTGIVKINHRMVPGIKSAVVGKNKSQVATTAPVTKDDGSIGFDNILLAFKSPDDSISKKQELAQKFSEVYNSHV